MTDTLWLIGAVAGLILALAGTVAGWVAFGRLRRWRLEQQAAMPVVHAELVAARHRVLEQAFDLDRQARDVADRLDTGGRDLAVYLLSLGFARLSGRTPGFWGPVVARMVVGKLGAERGG